MAIVHDPGKKGDAKSKKRLQRDLDIFKSKLKNDPKDTHALYFLAKTYTSLNEYEQAYELLQKIPEFTKKDGFLYLVYFDMGFLARRLKKPFFEISNHYLKAYSYAPHRAEPLVLLAELFFNAGNTEAAYLFSAQDLELLLPVDLNPVDQTVYTQTRYQFHIFICSELKRYDEGIEIMKKYFPENSAFFKCYMKEFLTKKKSKGDID